MYPGVDGGHVALPHCRYQWFDDDVLHSEISGIVRVPPCVPSDFVHPWYKGHTLNRLKDSMLQMSYVLTDACRPRT